MKIVVMSVACGSVVLLCALIVRGQDIYVTNSDNATVGEYTMSGAVVNASLISGLSDPIGIAVSGSDLFVVNYYNNTIGKYTTSGAVVNATFVSGLNGPYGIAVDGSNLFVTNTGNGTIGEYNATTGAVVNASLVSGFGGGLDGIAVSGSHLFVLNGSNNTIGEYTTSGAVVNDSLVSVNAPLGLVVYGSNLFVTDWVSGTIGEYTTSGGTVNSSLVSGLTHPYGIAISGSDLFVANAGGVGVGVIGEYTTSGVMVNSSLISGLDYPIGIAVSTPTPEPSSLIAWIGLGVMGLIACGWKRRSWLSLRRGGIMKRLILGLVVLVPTALATSITEAYSVEIINSYSEMPSDRVTLFPNPFFDATVLNGYGIIKNWSNDGAATYPPFSYPSSLVAPSEQTINTRDLSFTFNNPVYAVGFTEIAIDPVIPGNTQFQINFGNASYELTAYDFSGNVIGDAFSSSYGNILGPVEYHPDGRGYDFMSSYVGLWSDAPIYQVTVSGFRSSDGAPDTNTASFSFSSTPLETAGTVPEPSAFIVWSLLSAMGLVMAWRRRKQALA